MSHDQRPARVKMVGKTDRGAKQQAVVQRAAAPAIAEPPAVPKSSGVLLSVLFIAASIIGGIAIGLLPLVIGS